MAFSLTQLNPKKMLSNDTKTNLVIVLVIALCVGYIVNKQYQALLFLAVATAGAHLFCNQLFCALVIGIILTNLLLSMNYLKVTEGNTNQTTTGEEPEPESEPESESVQESLVGKAKKKAEEFMNRNN